MITRRPISRGLAAAAPWVSLALLVVLSMTLPTRVKLDVTAEQRKAEVAASMEAVPYFIGDWVGTDDDNDVPPEAQKLLRPNAIFSRRFQRPGDPGIHVLIVHCGDARDMIGHYPPICYPSSGWVAMGEAGSAEISIDDQRLPVRLYEFRRLRDQGTEDRIRIINGFILPDGTVTREIDDINRQSERLAVSVQGVAQLQLITSAAMSEGEALAAAGQLLGGMTEMLDALRVGQGANPDA